MDSKSSVLTRMMPLKDLSEDMRSTVFDHFFRRLASFRNDIELYILAEQNFPPQTTPAAHDTYRAEIAHWAQNLLENAWAACMEPGGGDCPLLDPYVDTSTRQLQLLPHLDVTRKILNTTLFLHITSSKQYSARTRAFLYTFGPVDESVIVTTLKDPEQLVREAQKQANTAKQNHAAKGKVLRAVGVGLGAVAGGVLVGVTGGLAAPLVGASVTTVLGWLGVGGTAAGLLASGLAGSSVVCGALFGAYGARSTASMVERHTREIRDLAIIPVHEMKNQETLAVRLCVSGWLSSQDDVTAPWTVFEGDDTFALQWEVEALQQLSNALGTLLKSHAMQYVKSQIVRRTVFASLMTSLSPIALLKIGQIIDNPWMNAKALAIKAGAVLGTLLAQRVFGTRPVTLIGYSLGSLVIFEALKHLAALAPSQAMHIVQDVYLFGSPIPIDIATWCTVRRLVCGRLINGYCTEDYVLAVLSRVSNASWDVAGLQEVPVKGVENFECKGVEGHLRWRGMLGKCLQMCNVPGVVNEEVKGQMEAVERIEEEIGKETTL